MHKSSLQYITQANKTNAVAVKMDTALLDVRDVGERLTPDPSSPNNLMQGDW